jgi:hypothetical protein
MVKARCFLCPRWFPVAYIYPENVIFVRDNWVTEDGEIVFPLPGDRPTLDSILAMSQPAGQGESESGVKVANRAKQAITPRFLLFTYFQLIIH